MRFRYPAVLEPHWSSTKRLVKSLAYRLPIKAKVKKPVFIVGCGRSGTTILGRLVGRHRSVVYLNEPHSVWFLDPTTDIWTADAPQRQGQLYLDAGDVQPTRAALIRRAFYFHLLRKRRRQLVEKTPINSFRIGYLSELFPDARFIHLIRSGAEVARSIARFGPEQWYGIREYKWRRLVRLATRRGQAELVKLCHDNFTKGLLEWRLSVSTALGDLRHIPQHRRLELRYEKLLQDPQDLIRSIEDFIDLPHSAEMEQFARKRIKRKSAKFDMSQLSSGHLLIAGSLLSRLGYLHTRETV